MKAFRKRKGTLPTESKKTTRSYPINTDASADVTNGLFAHASADVKYLPQTNITQIDAFTDNTAAVICSSVVVDWDTHTK